MATSTSSPVTSAPVTLSLVDTALLDDDNDTWIEACRQCGTLDNCGDNLCVACDEMAA